MEGIWGKVNRVNDLMSLDPGIGVAPTHTLVVTAKERGAFGLPPTVHYSQPL